MLISSTTDTVKELLEQYKPCLSKPQFKNFQTYTIDLITCEGKKNIQAINKSFINTKNQSSLNRFLTKSPWSLENLQEKRLSIAKQNVHGPQGSMSYLLLDDTINKKTGKHMQNAGYHYSYYPLR